ncbi:ATP-binding protein [Methylonatrum kenyense]|uniref:PAS domain-containing hybrid sensor histidine kinase/response regulator n=1 Tax=Methylonatrum kenyense TaxID=455253 RepID=UPI0020BD639F|nr:ATP-binding protein [Methylonatrum kenyense]MCK8515438.1 ATP-binding protein [Methylonatrum kenyense]
MIGLGFPTEALEGALRTRHQSFFFFETIVSRPLGILNGCCRRFDESAIVEPRRKIFTERPQLHLLLLAPGSMPDEMEAPLTSEQKIEELQRQLRRWLLESESKGEAGTLAGLEDDVRALDTNLTTLFPSGQINDDPLGTLREQAVFRTVLESMIEGVIVSDMDGRFLVFNAAAQELLGQGATEIGPEGWSEQYRLFYADGKTLCRSEDIPLARAMSGEVVDREELIIRAPRREEDTYISVSARPLWSETGAQLGGVVVFHDISGSKRTENELREASNQAEEASRTKSEFLANMSHEIRTPLTAVLGFADLLLDSDLGESDRLNYIQGVRRNSEHLLNLISDILDLSKLQANKVLVERADFSLHQLLHEIASVMQVRAYEKGLGFHVVYDTAIPVRIRNDVTRIRQILINLLSNAIKFTRRGSVTLSCRCLDPGTDQSRLEFSVSDTGLGMSKAEIDKLFQPFHQANLSTTREFGGTGLGLAICQSLTEALGGEMGVESQPGKGSVFRLELCQPVDANAEMVAEHCGVKDGAGQMGGPAANKQSLSGRILLAEDGLDNQFLISTMLIRQGLDVDIAGDGQKAVDMALQAMADEKAYDLILMDIQMPRLDGYGATASLRSKGYTSPIVALTAHAMAGEHERCLAAGCDDYLTKPILRPKLVEAVTAYLRSPQDDATQGGNSVEAALVGSDSSQAIYSSYADDPEMMDLVSGFVDRLSGTVMDIQAAEEANDFERLRRLVHQLKGAAGGYGFKQLGEAADALEQAVRDGRSPATRDSAMARLVQICSRVRKVRGGR